MMNLAGQRYIERYWEGEHERLVLSHSGLESRKSFFGDWKGALLKTAGLQTDEELRIIWVTRPPEGSRKTRGREHLRCSPLTYWQSEGKGSLLKTAGLQTEKELRILWVSWVKDVFWKTRGRE